MTFPTHAVNFDWEGAGTFTATGIDAVRVPMSISQNKGATGDYSGEATGDCTMVFRNDDSYFTRFRNECDNPSFEYDTSGWSVLAVSGLTVAATSITQVSDHATGTGTKAASIVLTGTNNSGVTFAFPYRIRNGVTYSGSFWLKSISGNLHVRAGAAAAGTVANIGSTSSDITTSWANYPFTFTATADRTDVVLFVRTTTAAVATLRVDCIQFNAGSSENTYLDGPSRGQLVSGKAVQWTATHAATDYGRFYGFIEDIRLDPVSNLATVTMFDPLRRYSETDVIVPVLSLSRSARETRIAALEDFERGNLNLVGHNPSFETDTANWTQTGTSLTRITTDYAPLGGTASAQFIASGSGQRAYISARLGAMYFDGEVYRGSVFLHGVSGSTSWRVGLGPNVLGTDLSFTTTTTDWRRFSVTYKMTADAPASPGLILWVESTGAGTVNIDCASVTRGAALYGYSDLGTGRWRNLVGNSSWDGQVGSNPAGYYDAFRNFITNGSFETNTSGWAITGGAFTANALSITRVGSGGFFASSRADVVINTTDAGAFFAITGTFISGRTYDFGITWKKSSGSATGTFGIGSAGTTGDAAFTSVGVTSSYTTAPLTWVPASNRTDAQFFVRWDTNGTYSIDGAYVFLRDTLASTSSGYVDSGPGGGGVPLSSSVAVTSATTIYGGSSLVGTTTAVANSGFIYDFYQQGLNAPTFVAGVTYSFKVRTDNFGAYKVGISANKGDGTYDEAATTGTTSGTGDITVSWTPSADYASTQPWQVMFFVYHTAASGVTIHVGGPRVIPAPADDFEMAQWNLATGAEVTDTYATTATFTGSALAAMLKINELTGSRMWIKYLTVAPWYQICTEDRTTFQSKASVATVSGADVLGSPGLDVERQQIINLVAVTHATGTEYYGDSDGQSVGTQGVRPAPSVIDGALFFADRTIPDLLGPLQVARYKDQHARPRIMLVGDPVGSDYSAIFGIDLQDDFVLNLTASLHRNGEYIVMREEHQVEPAGLWTVTRACEEFAY
jgi:hypothetical protein